MKKLLSIVIMFVVALALVSNAEAGKRKAHEGIAKAHVSNKVKGTLVSERIDSASHTVAANSVSIIDVPYADMDVWASCDGTYRLDVWAQFNAPYTKAELWINGVKAFAITPQYVKQLKAINGVRLDPDGYKGMIEFDNVEFTQMGKFKVETRIYAGRGFYFRFVDNIVVPLMDIDDYEINLTGENVQLRIMDIIFLDKSVKPPNAQVSIEIGDKTYTGLTLISDEDTECRVYSLALNIPLADYLSFASILDGERLPMTIVINGKEFHWDMYYYTSFEE